MLPHVLLTILYAICLSGKGFLKDLILRRDPTVMEVFAGFGSNPDFLEQAHDLIGEEACFVGRA